jgi:hypothetical protein
MTAMRSAFCLVSRLLWRCASTEMHSITDADLSAAQFM